ncbi:MAG: hypothetical protein MUC69_11245, partial [Gemmatimonadales bacterium]|nr:hypothetical protein [Gemmatimonadales bacterium]
TLLAAAAARRIPVALVNARLSERSAARYARASSLVAPMLRRLDAIGAQGEADAARLVALGARHPTVTGNLKFELALPEAMRERGAALRQRIGAGRPVWLAASTRDGEEVLLLDAMARHPLPDGALLVLVPRHPQRFDDVAALVRSRGLGLARRSRDDAITAGTRVLLGDTMGEMLAWCVASDLAFVGGSLLPFGGQNVLEPLAAGVPALVGPHTRNFEEITRRAIEAGAVARVADADALLRTVATLLPDPVARAAMSAAAARFLAQHRGALDRTWQLLAPLLPS